MAFLSANATFNRHRSTSSLNNKSFEDHLSEIENNVALSVNLRGKMSVAEVDRLALALRRNTSVSSLDLSRNKFGDHGSSRLVRTMQAGLTIRMLNLANNMICDDGMLAIADFLKQDTCLEVLLLMNNDAGDQSALRFAAALRQNSTLKTLNLENNDICREGAESFIEVVEQGTYLHELHLKDNNVPPPVIDRLDRLLESNAAIYKRTEEPMKALIIQAANSAGVKEHESWNEGYSGQKVAVNEMSTIMAALKWRPDRETNRPYRVLFVGEDGVGKAELARRAARSMHMDDKFPTMDQLKGEGKYMEFDVSQINGMPLIDAMVKRMRVMSGRRIGPVVFLEMIEKLDTNALASIVKSFETGILQAGSSQCDCRNALYITSAVVGSEVLRSVLQSDAHARDAQSLVDLDNLMVGPERKSILTALQERSATKRRKSISLLPNSNESAAALNDFVDPAILAKFNKVIPFWPVTEEDMAERARGMLKVLRREFIEERIYLGYMDPEVVNMVAEGLIKVLRENPRISYIRNFIAKAIQSAEIVPGDAVLLYLDANGVRFIRKQVGQGFGRQGLRRSSKSLKMPGQEVRETELASSIVNSWQRMTAERKKTSSPQPNPDSKDSPSSENDLERRSLHSMIRPSLVRQYTEDVDSEQGDTVGDTLGMSDQSMIDSPRKSVVASHSETPDHERASPEPAVQERGMNSADPMVPSGGHGHRRTTSGYSTSMMSPRYASPAGSKPTHWSKEDIATYLRESNIDGASITRLLKAGVDGEVLMMLNKEELYRDLKLPLGATMKVLGVKQKLLDGMNQMDAKVEAEATPTQSPPSYTERPSKPLGIPVIFAAS